MKIISKLPEVKNVDIIFDHVLHHFFDHLSFFRATRRLGNRKDFYDVETSARSILFK